MTLARHVLVLGGGANAEHDVSLESAAAVREALLRSRHLVTGLTIRPDGSWETLTGASIGFAAAIQRMRESDVIFPALHGEGTEDGTLAGLLEYVGIPYVGSGVRAGALAMDKWASKLIAQELGIATASGVLVDGVTVRGDMEQLTFPVIVKPVASGSSFGATRVERREDLEAAIAAARQFDSRVLVEEFVVGREVDVAVLRRASGEIHIAPPLEIGKSADDIFDTAQKYGATQNFVIPAELNEQTLTNLRHAAQSIYEAIGCDGVARVDFFLQHEQVVFNEVNTMPGMTAHSQVPRMFAVDDMSFAELAGELVASAFAPGARNT